VPSGGRAFFHAPHQCPRNSSSNRRDYISTKEFKWHPEAFRLVEASDAANRLEVKRDIERYAKRTGVAVIEFSTIFDSRPDPRKLFPLVS
jgi:hypothetical protein